MVHAVPDRAIAALGCCVLLVDPKILITIGQKFN